MKKLKLILIISVLLSSCMPESNNPNGFVSFWTKQNANNVGGALIYINGKYMGEISYMYSTAPTSCGDAYSVNTKMPAGNYTLEISDRKGKIYHTQTITYFSGKCILFEL